MRTIHKTLLSGAAVAAFLPAMALAQETTTEGTVTEVPVEIIETDDATIATTTTTEPAATEMAQDATAMDVTDVATTSAEPMDLSTWTYDDLYASGISVNQMVGADVLDPQGNDIGDVENVLFDREGQVLSIVAEVGGFLDIGDTHVNIPWDMVSAETWADGVVLPFTEDEVQNYVADDYAAGGAIVASEDVAEVAGDGAGQVETGANVLRVGDIMNSAVRMQEGAAYTDFGMVNDLIIQNGQVAAVLVTPSAGSGVYGYPYSGTVGFTPASQAGSPGTLDLPYGQAQTQQIQPFDPAMLMD